MAKSGTKNPTKSKRAAKAEPKWESRAVTRLIEAGSMTECKHCDERVKFKAREKHQQVICNVYVNSRWDHVEHFHAPCYEEAGRPFGDPAE
jgi:hypothetical protein